MSKATIMDNELLKNEINALNNYVSRDEYNLNVVEVMINEIQDIVKGLKPCEKTGTIITTATCPYCESTNVKFIWGSGMSYSDNDNKMHCSERYHYLCNSCGYEFDKDIGDLTKEELENDK